MVATEAEFTSDSQALAVRSSSALMPALSMQQAIERYEQIKEFATAVMETGRDYGAIPGAGKDKVLLKPGAEKLCTLFNLKPRLVILAETEDWMGADHGGEAFFSYHYKIQLYRNEEFMGEADAALNSWEEKYRWRSTNRKCPTCGAESIINGKKEYGGGFICFAKKGGCGAKFKDGDSAITSQQTGRAPNDRIYDQINTMRKMCYKRALIAATLVAVNASDFFTQDLENEEEAYQPHSPSPEPPREYDEPTGPARINGAQRRELSETAKEKGIPPEIATSIVQEFGFAKGNDVTVDKFEAVMKKLKEWQPSAPEPETDEEAEARLESADGAGNAPDNAQITPQPITRPIAQRAGEIARRMTEDESLKEKRKEILQLGQKLIDAGVPMLEVEGLIERKSGVRQAQHVGDLFDANAVLVEMESKLEQATAVKQSASKRGK